jgi:LPS-assembly lipoprotein
MSSYNIRLFHLFLALLLMCNLMLVDGCGFRLRGSLGSNVALPPTYLRGQSGSPILVDLKQTLQVIGTDVVSGKSQATYVLDIINEGQDRRILSVSSTGAIQEYELLYMVTFRVTSPQGAILLDTQTINLTRSFSYTETDLLAKRAEAEALYTTMRQDAVQGIIRRLQALKPESIQAPVTETQKTESQTTESQKNVPAK